MQSMGREEAKKITIEKRWLDGRDVSGGGMGDNVRLTMVCKAIA